jgi:predicted SpoU family rRNA methylase
MDVTSKKLEDRTIVVLFKNDPKSEIADLAICVWYDNVYDIMIRGEYKNVNFEKDKEKIADDIAQKISKEMSQALGGQQ